MTFMVIVNLLKLVIIFFNLFYWWLNFLGWNFYVFCVDQPLFPLHRPNKLIRLVFFSKLFAFYPHFLMFLLVLLRVSHRLNFFWNWVNFIKGLDFRMNWYLFHFVLKNSCFFNNFKYLFAIFYFWSIIRLAFCLSCFLLLLRFSFGYQNFVCKYIFHQCNRKGAFCHLLCLIHFHFFNLKAISDLTMKNHHLCYFQSLRYPYG